MKAMIVLSVLFTALLVTVSSCTEGQFTCKSEECQDAEVVCDFKWDCKDGSDEEFCGTCDFELHSCGWNSSSDGWKRLMVNTTSIPGGDHTTGKPWGHVMYTNKSKSDLVYSVDKLPALGCQISFWYYCNVIGSGFYSSCLKLLMTRGDVENVLLEVRADKINTWTIATVFLGNQPGGYKLLFSTPSVFGVDDNMLDDIRFENCGEGDVPAESDRLSCDFEKDACSWYHDYTANLLWKRSNREFQDDQQKNFCMLIKASATLNVSSTARLVSYPQPKGHICVSFSYRIFGNSIGSLKFITKHPGEAEDVIWIRSGTQGNIWRFADLTFDTDKPIQFIIESVVGGDQGIIEIDDIVVNSTPDGSCPPERECTFQGSLCGLQPQVSNSTWSRVRGADLPAVSSGPTEDHTLGTEEGYYLSAQLWNHSLGSTAVVRTAVLPPTPPDGECLMFWYYMEGSGAGELTVYLESLDEQLWKRSGDQGRHWRHGRVTLLSPGSVYQVIFEATAGNELERDIAIDDLTVLNGACPPEGFCDFEMDLCGWVNNPPAESGVYWDWLSGHSAGVLVPDSDHSTGSSLGHFLFFLGNNNRRIASLESETMMAVDKACLELWHLSKGWGSDRPSTVLLTVFLNESSGLRAVYETRGVLNGTWIQKRVDYSSLEPHQIVLQATFPGGVDEIFSLDDIFIIRDQSCNDSITTTTPVPPTATTPSPPSAMDCTFEQGLCNWVQEDSGSLNWTLSSGRLVDQSWDGPDYDHTQGNNEGFFLLLNGSRSSAEGKAVISVPVAKANSEICVGFWYYMLGPSVSTLDLSVQMETSKLLVWTRRATQNPEWMNAQVTISGNDVMRIMFTGHRKNKSQGFIAIDDVTVREGACHTQNVCGFESNLCDFQNDVNHLGHWDRKRGTNHQVDHSYGTEHGFYLTAMTTNSTNPKKAQLLTPEITSDTEMCVRFWYWLPSSPSNELVIYVMRSGSVGDALWQSSGVPSTDWEVAEVTVSSPGKFHVVFSTTHVPGSTTTVKLDDISVSTGACHPPVSCDFESGQCNWINIPREDGHDWFPANGGFHGPSTDHTTQTPEGNFLLSSSPHLDNSSLAQVVSEWIYPKDTAYCVSLWYYTDSSESGTLRVYVQFNRSRAGRELIFHANSSLQRWSRFSQTVNITKPFQLLIEGEASGGGFTAIDDVIVTPGQCKVNETSSGLEGCTFETGTCHWEDKSVGQSQWVRGRNATGNTGPPVDHTLGTDLGWYMAVEPDTGDQITPAALQGPMMSHASTTCTLHFYYNMYGEDHKELSLLVERGSRSTALWWRSGGHGNLWQHGEVVVGRIPQDFNFLFSASRTFNKPGHLAIDDISFTNCSLPEPQPQCPENMFTCNNSACVEHNQVCDFSDDCGDWSDERHCERHGVVERCSFERGLCSWAESEGDKPGDEWKVHAGQEAWPNLGPPRDHTHNFAAGSYIVPGTHLSTKGETSEIVSKTLLPSLNCTMRFFYFSLNDTAAAGLSALSRTWSSGSGDAALWLQEKSQSYSWQRAEVTFSSSSNSKIVFRYELGDGKQGTIALDDISFSKECVFDADNNQLPDPPPTSTPPTTAVTPCQENEFFCWASAGKECILSSKRCDYHTDCSQGEDEDGCGPCTFEKDQCQWSDTSEGQIKWQRQKASITSVPPTDHTTQTGFYMKVNISQRTAETEARLQSPPLPPSSPYCQILFHFHISAESTGSLRVLMQQAGGSEAILWSHSHKTVSNWTTESLFLGLHHQPYKILFSAAQGATETAPGIFAVDDIAFVNCNQSYQPPALSAYDCSFEEGLCVWMQGAEDELDWFLMSGPTETPNTGPAGDHTTSKGRYLYVDSFLPHTKGKMAQLKSLLLPPAGEEGYCFTLRYHMFGATVGSLKMFLQTANPLKKTLVWQKSGNQEDEWLLMQSHVTLQQVHQVVLEASVGGRAGDIAIDDIGFSSGPCPKSDLCDFEEGTCDWQQHTNDDYDWVRKSGSMNNPNTGPDADHTTDTSVGHYYYLPSSAADHAHQTAAMSSPLYPAGKGACVQLWYHLYGQGVGTLNVYQQSEGGQAALILSQTGDHGRMWRFTQASLLPREQPYKIVVEGVKAGPTQEGDMAFDDVQLTEDRCPAPEFCDFEINMCSWSNLGDGVDQGDWLRGSGGSSHPHTGPSFDHTTNTTHGHYLYVDCTVGEWGDRSFLVSEVFQWSTGGHCLTFWYHMKGDHVGTLRVYINDRKMQNGGNEEGILKWTETGNKGDQWKMANVYFKHEEAFWFVFVYQRGSNPSGDVALDDIRISPGSCSFEPPINPPSNGHDTVSIVLAVIFTLLAGFVFCFLLFFLNKKWRAKRNENRSGIDENSVIDLNCQTNSTEEHQNDFSFDNQLYDQSPTFSHSDA